jgi:hypothetical protein
MHGWRGTAARSGYGSMCPGKKSGMWNVKKVMKLVKREEKDVDGGRKMMIVVTMMMKCMSIANP